MFNVLVELECVMVALLRRLPDAREDENDLDWLRSAYAVSAPPGVGFGGWSLDEGNVSPSPKESNLVTKAANARLSSSNFNFAYTTNGHDQQPTSKKEEAILTCFSFSSCLTTSAAHCSLFCLFLTSSSTFPIHSFSTSSLTALNGSPKLSSYPLITISNSLIVLA